MPTVDPTKAKRNINFDTYEAPDKEARVNWFQQAKTISDAFTGVATDRQERKDAIDADTKKNLDALNNLDSMDNKTLMDMTIDGSNSAANAIYEAEQKMKRGELRPQDFQKLKQNISSGFTQFQKNAKSWDADFKRYTERMEGGKSSSLEQYLGERMESFGNLKNLQLVTNPDTGNLAFGRIDENGNLLTGPDDLISINRMSAISKQEINKVNVGEQVNTTVTELGDYITAGNATTMGKDGSSRAVVTVEDFMQTPEAEVYLEDKAKALTSSPFQTGSVLADNGVKNSKGESFTGGDQAQFDQWNADNPGMEDQNPIIVMGYKENGVVVEPAITEGQQKAARDYITRSLKAKLGHKETMKESTWNPNKKTNYEIQGDKQVKKASNIFTSLDTLITGDASDAEGAATELATSINAQNTGKKDYANIQTIERVGDQFVIHREGKEPFTVDALDADNNELSGDAIGAAIWNQVTDGEVTFEEAAKGRTIGDRNKSDAKGTKTSTKTIEQPDYNTKIVVDGEEVSVESAVSKINDLGGTWPNNNIKERAKDYQNVMQEIFKNKNTPGLESAFKGEEIKVFQNPDAQNNLIFQIGQATFRYPEDVPGYEEGALATDMKYDEYSDIWPQIELFIGEQIKLKKNESKGRNSKKQLP